MRCFHQRVQPPGQIRTKRYVGRFVARFLLAILPGLALTSSLFGQEMGSQEKEFLGNGSVITVAVHDASGQAFSSSAVVKLIRGVVPTGQRETSRGVAEFVIVGTGQYTVVVAAPGYAEVQKDVSLDGTGIARVDVYLRQASGGGSPATVPGRPLLAPKAKEALDKGLRALRENKLAEAEKYLGEALRLAPGNPEVLYAQGILSLHQRDWGHAQTVLEKATQIDPHSAPAFAALGLALCDQGNYDAAIAPLRKSLELDPAGAWETRWALAKSYYQHEQYPEALNMSQEALARSNGNAPAISLLVAQSLTAVGRYEDAAEVLRQFLKDHANQQEAATARRWLEHLTADGKIRSN
ncbi:MAG: tetratricopeptide repeat protein [Candidatus Acidiferrales bacterium]